MSSGTQTTKITPKPTLEIEKFSEAAITCLKCRGTINEQLDGKHLAGTVKAKTLVLDLSGVEKISSFGIREWSAFIGAVEKNVDNIYLLGCTPRVINQINMVTNFVGRSLIFSFYAPYRCDYCESTKQILLNVDRDFDAIKKLKPPERICETCGNPEYFDDDPVTFFAHVANQRPFDLDQKVATFLVSKLNYAVTDLARRIQATKTVEGRYTYLKIIGNLEGSFPADKLAEGLEGVLALDVSGIGGLNPAGAAQFRRFMSLTTTMSERVNLVGAQPVMLEHALHPEDLGNKVQVLSFAMPYQCQKCATTSLQTIDVLEHYEVLKLAMPPPTKCPDCGSSTHCVATGALLSHLTNLPAPKVDDGLRKFVKKVQKQKTEVQPKKPEQGGGVSARSIRLMVGFAVTAVAVILAVGYVQSQRNEELMQKAVNAINKSYPKRPPWITSDTPSSAYCTDLSNRTVCVGVSSFAVTKEEGRNEAWDSGLEALVNAVGLRIDDAYFGEHQRKVYADARQTTLSALQGPAEDPASLYARDRAREARQSVARALEASGGAAVPTQMADWYWEEYEARGRPGSEFLVFARVDVGTDAMKALIDRYQLSADVQGAKVVSAFPAMAWRNKDAGKGALIAALKPGLLKDVGLAEGDTVIAMSGQPVRDATDFVERMKSLDKKERDARVKLTVQKSDGSAIEFDRPVGGR
jgi:hypothetical protein